MAGEYYEKKLVTKLNAVNQSWVPVLINESNRMQSATEEILMNETRRIIQCRIPSSGSQPFWSHKGPAESNKYLRTGTLYKTIA